jgi:hypothetical protein
MDPLFYGDPDHGRTDLIDTFAGTLRQRYQEGYRTLFLEFLYEDPPTSAAPINEQFIDCGGRRAAADRYTAMVLHAQTLGFTVHGLELKEYFSLSRGPQAGAYFAFRLLGGYDAICAEIIRQRATSNHYIVRLGAAHWPLIKNRLPFLTCTANQDDSLADPSQFSQEQRSTAALYQRTQLKKFVARAMTVSSIKVVFDYFGKKLTINMDSGTSAETLAMLWQDKEGLPPDPDRVEAIISVLSGG